MFKSLKRWWSGTPPYYVEVFLGPGGQWLWRLKHSNGNTLAVSETYSAKDKALQTAINFARWTGVEVIEP